MTTTFSKSRECGEDNAKLAVELEGGRGQQQQEMVDNDTDWRSLGIFKDQQFKTPPLKQHQRRSLLREDGQQQLLNVGQHLAMNGDHEEGEGEYDGEGDMDWRPSIIATESPMSPPRDTLKTAAASGGGPAARLLLHEDGNGEDWRRQGEAGGGGVSRARESDHQQQQRSATAAGNEQLPVPDTPWSLPLPAFALLRSFGNNNKLFKRTDSKGKMHIHPQRRGLFTVS
jgi:hypothetical protein